MGAGKSSVGRKLGKRLGLEVLDTDNVVEKNTGMKISEVFREHGEARFRELEREAMKKVSELQGHVIITGGGVVLDKRNIEDLRKNGIIIYLHAAPEVLYERVKHDSHRPLLQVDDPLSRIRELLAQREPFYADNDIEIDTTERGLNEVVKEIIKRVDIKLD